PLGLDDPDPGITDGADQLEGGVFRLAHVDHHFVAHRQQRTNAGHDWEVELDGVADDGETGDGQHPQKSPRRFLLTTRGDTFPPQMHVALYFHDRLPVKGYGGTQRVVVWLARGLAQLGHRVSLIAGAGSKVPEATLIPLALKRARAP